MSFTIKLHLRLFTSITRYMENKKVKEISKKVYYNLSHPVRYDGEKHIWNCLSALFTSVLVDPALRVIKDLLEKRPHPQR